MPERGIALSVTLIFHGDKLTWVDKDGIHYQEDTITLMPDQSPKAIDNWSKGRSLEFPTKKSRGVKGYAACSYSTGDW